jgi:predicted nucleic acid-binding protein
MSALFVLDNSVAMRWCFQDDASGYAERVLDRLEDGEAAAPAVWPLEVGNALVVAERKGRLSPTDAASFLALLGDLTITVIQEPAERMLTEIFSLARQHQLTTYDASYLDLALRLGVPLATRDAALIRAAKKCGVALYHP